MNGSAGWPPALVSNSSQRLFGAAATAVSPDQRTLLVLTSGFNRNSDIFGNWNLKASQQYVFVYNIAAGRPERKQVLKVSNSFAGLSFDPSGQLFYVGGGSDDNIHVFVKNRNGTWVERDKPISLKNKPGNGYTTGAVKRRPGFRSRRMTGLIGRQRPRGLTSAKKIISACPGRNARTV